MDAPLPLDADLVLQVDALDRALSGRILEASRRTAEIRYRDGYVFQHLLSGPVTVSELGRLLRVSQQAASKQVADLERRALVEVDADPRDGRVRLVTLTPTARRSISAARRARAALTDEVAQVLGARPAAQLQRSLSRLAEHFGADELVRNRWFAPEEAR